jgi:hypothetical protein
MPCWKRMTNPKFCYHLGCLKTSCNMQHDMDNLLVSVLETMTFYKGANLIFSSQFSDVLSATPDCTDSLSNDVLGFCSILSLKTSPT